MGMLKNGLKVGLFNESLAQKPTLSLAKVVTRAKCHTKGEERNAVKKTRDVKEYVPNAECSHHQRKSNYTSPIKDNTVFKRVRKMVEIFTPLNTQCEQIWRKVLHLHNILTLPSLNAYVIGHGTGRRCKFHRVKGHHIKDCYQLNKSIDKLIYEGHLKKYVKGNSSCGPDKSISHERYNAGRPRPSKAKEESQDEGEKIMCHMLNTITYTTRQTTFYDNYFTSHIKKPRYNSWMRMFFYFKNIQSILSVFIENWGINWFSVHASNSNNFKICFYFIKSGVFLNILLLI